MSFPEYRQKPQDHRSCIVLVRPIGSFVSKDSFSKIWAQLSKLEKVAIGKDGRSLHIRYMVNYPIENSEWGDFQYHRKVLGLICVAQHNEKVTGADLDKLYLDLKNLYDSTLLDSRLVILGLPRNAVRPDRADYEDSIGSSLVGDSLVIDPNHYDEDRSHYNKPIPDLLDRCNDGLKQLASDVSENTRRRILSYSDTEEACSYLNMDIEHMCQALFYVLESKRLTATNTHLKQPSIITAPFEKPGVINMDLETKAVRNRFVARCRKRIGDLCMLVDLPHDAVVQYQASLELLDVVGDGFWIGGALEGISVASSLVLAHQEKTSLSSPDNGMKRTSSFNGSSTPGLLLDPSITLHNSFNHLDLASTKTKLNVTFDDIISKYRDAISYYSKFPSAAIVEMEASLKATRLLIDHKVGCFKCKTCFP